MFGVLEEIKAKLSELKDAKSVKIGLEGNLNAAHCPFIRIISLPSRPASDNFRVIEQEVEIVFGESIYKNNNLEEIYQKLYQTEELIKAKMQELPYQTEWIQTVPDGDRLLSVKVSSIYFRISKVC